MKRKCLWSTLASALLSAPLQAGDGLFSFFANYSTGQLEVLEHDPVSGQPLGTRVFVDTGGMASPTGLAWHRDRFITIIQNQAGHRGMVEIHPATGVGDLVGWSGMQLFSQWPESDPASGELLYMAWESFNTRRFYRVDPLTGVTTPSVLLHGATTALDSFCIDSTGRGFGTVNLDLYSFDPSSGLTIFLGPLAATSAANFFGDLACSSTGDIVGLLLENPPYATTGLYRIDPSALTATPLVLMPGHSVPALGVAFAPDRSGTRYCQAKPNSLSCLPSIRAHGFPSTTANGGYEISCSNVRSQTQGVLLHGIGGAQSLPFQGGILCIAGPLRRTQGVNSQGSPPGSPNCDGSWTVDFNAHLWQFASGSPAQSLPPGTTIHAQWYGRDQGYGAPNNTSLSDGLRITLMP